MLVLPGVWLGYCLRTMNVDEGVEYLSDGLWMDSTRLFPCGLCEVIVPEVMPDCWRRYWKLLLMNSGPLLCTPSGPDVVEEATTFNHFNTPTYNPNGEMDKADMETNATAEEVEENTNMNNMNDHLGDEGMETQTHT